HADEVTEQPAQHAHGGGDEREAPGEPGPRKRHGGEHHVRRNGKEGGFREAQAAEIPRCMRVSRPAQHAVIQRREDAHQRVPPSSGTKETRPSELCSKTSPRRSTSVSSCRPDGPTGITSRPPSASCSSSAGGISSGAAVTMMPSYGAYSGQPQEPSLCFARTLRRLSSRNRRRARTSKGSMRSTVLI